MSWELVGMESEPVEPGYAFVVWGMAMVCYQRGRAERSSGLQVLIHVGPCRIGVEELVSEMVVPPAGQVEIAVRHS